MAFNTTPWNFTGYLHHLVTDTTQRDYRDRRYYTVIQLSSDFCEAKQIHINNQRATVTKFFRGELALLEAKQWAEQMAEANNDKIFSLN